MWSLVVTCRVLSTLGATGMLVTLAPLAAGHGTDRAAYAFVGGEGATGRYEYTCEGLAVVPAPGGNVQWHATGTSVLTTYTTWRNSTVAAAGIAPVEVSASIEQQDDAVALDPGDVVVGIRGGGSARVLAVDWASSNEPRLHVAFAGSSFESGPATDLHALGTLWTRDEHGVHEVLVGVGGNARETEAPASTGRVTGPVALYLQDAVVTTSTRSISTGPYRTVERQGNGDVTRISERIVYATLTGPDAHVAWDHTGANVLCGSGTLGMQGTLTVHGATGRVMRGSSDADVRGRTLTLKGRFAATETLAPMGDPGPARVQVQNSGQMEAVGIDFVRQETPSYLHEAAAPAAAVLAVGASAALLASILWPLFTRIDTGQVLRLAERRLLHDVVRANPGLTLTEIATRAAAKCPATRYHLGVLGRHGLLKTVRVQGRVRYVPPDGDPAATLKRFLLERDEKVRSVVERLSARPIPAKVLIEELGHRWGITRSGGWRVIERAHRADLVWKEYRAGEVILRCVPVAAAAQPAP